MNEHRCPVRACLAGMLLLGCLGAPGAVAGASPSADSASAKPVPSSTGTAAPSGEKPAAAKAKLAGASQAPALFGVYTARLDGSEVAALITDDEREMTHARVSPDRTRVVLTRYNRKGSDGKATEQQGYEQTEIAIVNLDGTGLEVVVPAKPGVIAANGDWTPDGKSLIYISTDNARRDPEIRHLDLATRKSTRMPTPDGLKASDPHWKGNQLVFPVKGKDVDALWLMSADGRGARQITRPAQTRSVFSAGDFGDFDPRLSPDGTKVAFMRIAGGDTWRIVVLDIATGVEKTLTKEGVVEGLPTWTSDGALLLFRHIERSRPEEIGLWTMTPAGEDRRIVPLPRGYLYNHGSFFPGETASARARIICSAMRMPGL